MLPFKHALQLCADALVRFSGIQFRQSGTSRGVNGQSQWGHFCLKFFPVQCTMLCPEHWEPPLRWSWQSWGSHMERDSSPWAECGIPRGAGQGELGWQVPSEPWHYVSKTTFNSHVFLLKAFYFLWTHKEYYSEYNISKFLKFSFCIVMYT